MSDTKNKQGNRFFILQRQLCRRRLWLIAAVVLYMVMYYPVAVVMLIARSNEVAKLQNMSPELTLSQRLVEVGTWIGMRQGFLWVIVLMAVILAIHGFSYLFSMEKQDFYESQPISRMERFWSIYANGFLIFEIPLVIGMFLSIVLAMVMNGMSMVTFVDAMLELVRLTIIFFSSYSLGILAVMLSGNLVVSGIMAVLLMFADQACVALVQSFENMFYKTYCFYGQRNSTFLLSPFYNAMAPSRWINSNYHFRYARMNLIQLKDLLSYCWKADLVSILVGATFLAISIALYRKRKAEYAGVTILYRPVRTVIRIAVSVAAGLFAGQVIINLFNSPTSRTGTVFMMVGIVFVTVLCSGIVEMVYELDIWKFFVKFWEIAAAAILAAGIFVMFRYDLLGYDRYVPKESEVESAALYVYNDNSFYYPMEQNAEESTGDETHVLEDMKLTDISSVLAVTGPGMELQREESDDSNAVKGWGAEVCYRMKDGRKVYRSITIPYSLDADVLDAITGSIEYKEGLMPVYSDRAVSETAEKNGTLSFCNGFRSLSGNGALYREFAKAYRKDLEHYSFRQMNEENSIGRVSFEAYRPCYMSMDFDVYPSYENTIAFLQSNGLYPEETKAEDIEGMTVTEYTDNSSSSAEFTETEEIQDILKHSMMLVSSNWKDSTGVDYQYGISIALKQGEASYFSLNFREGEIPAFVLKGLEENRVQNDDGEMDDGFLQ